MAWDKKRLRKTKRRGMRRASSLVALVRGGLKHRSPKSDGLRFTTLWRAWEDVLGPLAPLMKPLGHKDRTLILGVEDSLLMQEAAFYTDQILTNVNAFLEEEVFDKVRVNLLMGKTPLDAIRSFGPEKPPSLVLDPGRVGGLTDLKDGDTALARAYRAYIDRMARERTGKEGPERLHE